MTEAPATTTEAPEAPSLFGVKTPANLLSEYLAAEASATEIGTLDLPRPYITKNGRVYAHSRSMLKWAQGAYGKKVTKADVQRVMRELGLKVRATAVPGTGKSVGFYTGQKPKGVVLKGLPVRDLRKKAEPVKASTRKRSTNKAAAK